jgi:Phospholipase_D-nuclease N-terminal
MLFIDGGLLLLALWLFCIIDVIVTDEWRVRNLPKGVWVLLVLVLPDIGSIAWLVAGRPWDARTKQPPTRVGREFPEYDRPGRHIATNPDDDETFLREVRARAEEQRRKAALERKEREAREQDGAAS